MSLEADSEKEEVEKAVEEKDKELKPAAATNAVVKRRTKTGCLTCRKRRIKCGEEKPSCKNCIKSNRDCAGYKQVLANKNHDAQMNHYYSTYRRTRSKQEHHQMKTTLNHYHHQPNQPNQPNQPQHDPCVGLQQVQYHPTRSGSQQHHQHFQYPIADPSKSYVGVSPLKTSVHRRHHSGQRRQEILQQHYAPHYFEPQRHGYQDHWPLRTTPFEEQSQFYPEPDYASITLYEPYLSNGETCQSYPTTVIGGHTSSRQGLEGHHPSLSSLAEDEQW